MTFDLTDKTVLVTGGASGIGAAFAQLAVDDGARVILVGRDAAALEAAARRLDPDRVLTFAVDLTDRAALTALTERLDREGIAVDVLVNNAGSGASGPFVEDDGAKIGAMLELNIGALTSLTHWAARGMVRRGHGRIINLSAAVATRPVPFFAAYAASKAYVTNLSVALAQELKGSGVTVTAVHPPAVATRFAESGSADLKATLVLKLFGPLGPSPASVASQAYRAARKGQRVVNAGPIAWAIYRSGFILPNVLDLPIMAVLFRHRAGSAPEIENVKSELGRRCAEHALGSSS
jgi:hypothetical protein